MFQRSDRIRKPRPLEDQPGDEQHGHRNEERRLWEVVPLTIDPASWFFPYSLMSMLLFGALAVYGFVIALGNKLTSFGGLEGLR